MGIKMNASLEFTEYSIGKKVLFGQKVCECLAGESKIFTNLPEPVSTLLATTTELGDAEKTAMSGDRVAIEKKNELNKLWNAQFRKTAMYVSLVADGNATVIKSSGFECTKGMRHRKAKIEMINNFTADVKTAKGTAEVSCKHVKGANGYVVIAATGNTKVSLSGDDIVLQMNGEEVRIKTCTQSHVTLSDLPSKTTVGISMLAFNSAGCSPITDAQTITPQ